MRRWAFTTELRGDSRVRPGRALTIAERLEAAASWR